MKQFAIPALLAAVLVAALATAIWSGSSRADACELLVTRVVNGHWATLTVNCTGLTQQQRIEASRNADGRFNDWVRDAYGNRVASDQVKPGVIEQLNSDGSVGYRGVYVGDRVATPVKGTDNVVRTVSREIAVSYTYENDGDAQHPIRGSRYTTTPQRPVVSHTDERAYTADSNNRVVRDADGRYYREERVRGRWQRSGSYGNNAEALRRASWNAYLRAQNAAAVDPADTDFPSDSPPVAGDPQRLVSNTGRFGHKTSNAAGLDIAQAFRTGVHSAGYRVVSITLQVTGVTGSDWDVQLWSDDGDSWNPGRKLATLDKPTSVSPGQVTFTVPRSGIDLRANTRYWVVVNSNTEGQGLRVRRVASGELDGGAAYGWHIDIYNYTRGSDDEAWERDTFKRPHQIRITGSLK